MSISKQDVIKKILPDTPNEGEFAEAFAPGNIALCKYWGKRNTELNLPINGSLSISLGTLGSRTSIAESETGKDQVYLKGELLDDKEPFVQRVIPFVNLFRKDLKQPVCIKTNNNLPTAAGLASSASGFAALMRAINDFYHLGLSRQNQSTFARMGSGSAARSIYRGFVEWYKGEREDGMDSYAEPYECTWQELRIGLLKVATDQKKISSSLGMQRTVNSSVLYRSWAQQADQDLAAIKRAISDHDLEQLGAIAEKNALSMHATMISAWPPLLYWTSDSIEALHRVWEMRELGIAVYLTMDAGPNLKLIFQGKDEEIIRDAFPELQELDIVAPFKGRIDNNPEPTDC